MPPPPHLSRPPSEIGVCPQSRLPSLRSSEAGLHGSYSRRPARPGGDVSRAPCPPAPALSACPLPQRLLRVIRCGIAGGSHLSSYRLRCAGLRTGRTWGGGEAWRGRAVPPGSVPTVRPDRPHSRPDRTEPSLMCFSSAFLGCVSEKSRCVSAACQLPGCDRCLPQSPHLSTRHFFAQPPNWIIDALPCHDPAPPIIPTKLMFRDRVEGLEVLKGPSCKRVKKPQLGPGVPETAREAEESKG